MNLDFTDPLKLTSALLESAEFDDDLKSEFDSLSKAEIGSLVYRDENFSVTFTEDEQTLRGAIGTIASAAYLIRASKQMWVVALFEDDFGVYFKRSDTHREPASWTAFKYHVKAGEAIAADFLKRKERDVDLTVSDEGLGLMLIQFATDDQLGVWVENGDIDEDVLALFTSEFIVRAADNANLDLARKLAGKSASKIKTSGYSYSVSDYKDVTYVFGDAESIADEYYDGDTYDWFDTSETYPIREWLRRMTPKCWAALRSALVGKEVSFYDEDTETTENVELTEELLASTSDKQLFQWLDETYDTHDGLESVRDKIEQAGSDAERRARENEFAKDMNEALVDALGPFSFVGDILVFMIPWAKMAEIAERAREDSHRYEELSLDALVKLGAEKQSIPTVDGYVTNEVFEECFLELF